MCLFDFFLDEFLLLEVCDGSLLLSCFKELLDFVCGLLFLGFHLLHVCLDLPHPSLDVKDGLVSFIDPVFVGSGLDAVLSLTFFCIFPLKVSCFEAAHALSHCDV